MSFSNGRTHVRLLCLTLVPLALALPVAALADEAPAHAHEHDHDDHGATETIVVTASPLEHDRDELSVPVDRVERDELLENLGSTLGETLNLPGIATTGFTGGASRPVIRGQDAYRTEVLEDGLRTQDVSRESPDHAVPVSPLAAERVEVIRGPSTLRYGGGASAGVVNVITNRVPDQLSEEGISGEVYGGIGLLANERDLAAKLEGTHGNFAWHADGLFRRQNDYSIANDDTPHVQNGTSTEAFTGSVGGAYLGDWGRFGASYTRIENEYGLPVAGEDITIEMHSDRFRFEGDLIEPLPGIREVRIRGVYSDYEHDELDAGSIGQTYRNEEFDGRIEALHEEIGGFTGAIGYQNQHRDFRGEGEAAEFLSPADTMTNAFYLFEERPLGDDLALEAGFRVEHTRVQGTDINDLKQDLDFVPISGSLGFVFTPHELVTIGVNGSANQRPPSQVELLARGAHEATETFERGDSNLDEETSFTGDFRIEIAPERGRLEVAAFVTRYEDYIFAARTGNLVDETGLAPGDLAELQYTARDALFYGFEVAGDVDLFELDCGTIGLDGRFDFVRARFDGNGLGGSTNVPRITPVRWGAGVLFEGEATKARLGFLRTEAQDQTGDGETRTNNYTYLNASLSHKVEITDDVPVTLSIQARNLTDVRGRNHVAFNKDSVLLPGRSIQFGLRTQF